MQASDASQLICVYFIYTASSLLRPTDGSEASASIVTKEHLKGYVYEQLLPDKDGFVGGPYLPRPLEYTAYSHLANTYSALCLLVQSGDLTLSNVNKLRMIENLGRHQRPDGCMMFLPVESEGDVRACYCAVATAYMCRVALKSETGVEAPWGFDRSKLINYIVKCRTIQGGFGFDGNPEAHSGLTYCAVAALKMLGFQLDR